MIVTRTPMRVSLAGGFADVAAQHGAVRRSVRVLSCTVALHSTMVVSTRADREVVASYSRLERVGSTGYLQNSIFKACLEDAGYDNGIEVHSISKLPLASCGLGGSGAATVGLIHALYLMRGTTLGSLALAEKACDVEIRRLGRKIGKQDQYAAAVGGLNLLRFTGNAVDVERMPFAGITFLHGACAFIPCLNGNRDAADKIGEQLISCGDVPERLDSLVDAAIDAVAKQDSQAVARVVDAGWELKRSLSSSVSTPRVDEVIARVRAMGGGAKLCGAGGGGFVFAILPDEDACARCLAEFADAFPCEFESRGSEVIYDDWERKGSPWRVLRDA